MIALSVLSTLAALPGISGIPGVSALSFATPGWLLLGALLPLLLLAYRRRREVHKKLVSTLFLIRDVVQKQPNQNRVQLPLRFFVELLILLLLLLATTTPSLERRGDRIALLFDSSLSMQATKREKSRFQMAITTAEKLLNDSASSTTFSLFLSAPKLTPVSKSADEGGVSHRDARALLSELTPSLSSDTLLSSVMQLASSGEYDEVVVLTDKLPQYLPSSEGTKRTKITIKTVGEELLSNYFLTNLRLEREQGGENRVVVGVGFSGANTAEVVVKLFSQPDPSQQIGSPQLVSQRSSVLSSKAVTLSSDRPAELSFPVSGEVFRVELSHLGGRPIDSIQADNTGWIAGGSGEKKEILLVTPFRGLGQRFAPIPGVNIREISPEQYAELAAANRLEQFAVILFHQTTPLSIPASPTLFILPPAESPIVRALKEISQPRISSWAGDHPVMTYLRVPNFQPERIALLDAPPWTRAILNVESGPILVAGEQGGRRMVATGFELLPFEGGKTPFLSVLTLNILSWLSSVVSQESSLLTGSSFQLNGGENLTLPNGESVSPQAPSLFLKEAGLYRIVGGGRNDTFAVNVLHPEESNTFISAPLNLPREVGHEELPTETKGRVWWYLVAIATALVIIDIVLLLLLAVQRSSSENHGRKLHRLYT